MAYEMVMPYHLHMPSYFLETFTEYPIIKLFQNKNAALDKIKTSEQLNPTYTIQMKAKSQRNEDSEYAVF